MNTVRKQQQKGQAHKIQLPVRQPLGRLHCPRCGNSTHFVEQLESVMVTTTYKQNADGAFTPVEQNSIPDGDVSFHCGECGYDLTGFHAHFREMLF